MLHNFLIVSLYKKEISSIKLLNDTSLSLLISVSNIHLLYPWAVLYKANKISRDVDILRGVSVRTSNAMRAEDTTKAR